MSIVRASAGRRNIRDPQRRTSVTAAIKFRRKDALRPPPPSHSILLLAFYDLISDHLAKPPTTGPPIAMFEGLSHRERKREIGNQWITRLGKRAGVTENRRGFSLRTLLVLR